MTQIAETRLREFIKRGRNAAIPTRKELRILVYAYSDPTITTISRYKVKKIARHACMLTKKFLPKGWISAVEWAIEKALKVANVRIK